MPPKQKFVNTTSACEIIRELGNEFAVIKNPDYIHPAYELYPLAPKISEPVDELVAAVMDMDGTTTTTESLCLHSLECMIRKITDRISPQSWDGLDHQLDYPHIIGNSTTKHVEFLIQKYESLIQFEAVKKSYFYAALWFLVHGKDQRRVEEVKNNLIILGCQELLKDPVIIHLEEGDCGNFDELISRLVNHYGDAFQLRSFSDKVRAGIDIYYQRYHEILSQIQAGRGESLAAELLAKTSSQLIEPMPGVGEFLALIKGWLGEDVVHLVPQIFEMFQNSDPESAKQLDVKTVENNLKKLGIRFQNFPLKVAVVTSSISYEAEIVLAEVFRVLQSQVEKWPIARARKKMIQEKFSDFRNVYDGFITASDSSEIRLKPHRDLYSIALHQLGIPKDKFHQVVGFEDSESGTIAIRAAGIGLCLAVPFVDTKHHDLSAASHILKGGLPELMMKHNLFIKQNQNRIHMSGKADVRI
ncbi:MAG: hypothetical protein MUC94_04635 [bacterium]|nr:hypothetical protein [bacterium]